MAPATAPVDALVEDLSTDEKLSLVRGTVPPEDEMAAGYLPPIERHGVGSIRMVDGPLGVRLGESTAFPASIALGAAFDPGLATEFGRALATEARSEGIDVVLAPGCNLVRVPQCGRAFEYYGEDPYHVAACTAATVEGIQAREVAAVAKHYVANGQETDRVSVSAEVGERALRECYLPAFEAAVDADVAAVMAAYNRVNGTYATEHEALLTGVLKGEFGFDGPVMSDWWAVEDGPAAARAGLDLEMPGVGSIETTVMATGRGAFLRRLEERWPDGLPGPEEALGRLVDRIGPAGSMPDVEPSQFSRFLPDALASGEFSEGRLDDMVRRVLSVHERVGALDGERPRIEVDWRAHRDLARRIAVRGSVLLKNQDDALPLDPDASLALVGPNVDEAKVGGGGSSEVTPRETVSPVEGVRDRAERSVLVERGHPPVESTSLFDVGPSLGSLFDRRDDEHADVSDAQLAASSTRATVVVVQDDATEARDRESLALPGEQDRLISAVAEAAGRTIVVLQTAGPVEMPWLEEVDAVVQAWYPGQEAGAALADVLFGDSEPGGRLPITFGAAAGDYPANSTARYPGVVGTGGYRVASYDEGVFVGYRHFDERGMEPLFPFGHGLGYAEFAYGDASVSLGEGGGSGSVDVTLENVGDRPGREVVQVYLSAPESSVPRPPRELAGFASVRLDPGEQRSVEVWLDDRAFSFYDPDAGEWRVESGEHELVVGRSSRDLRLVETVSIE